MEREQSQKGHEWNEEEEMSSLLFASKKKVKEGNSNIMQLRAEEADNARGTRNTNKQSSIK